MSIRFHTPTYDIIAQVLGFFLLYILVDVAQRNIWFGVIILVVLLFTLTVFSLNTQIEIENNNLTISKYYLGYQYFNYQWKYTYIHIENNYTISFVNFLSTRLRFEYDFDDVYNYFVCYIGGKKVILGNEKGFTKFKESLEEWNKE
jgi:hypothetical protein